MYTILVQKIEFPSTLFPYPYSNEDHQKLIDEEDMKLNLLILRKNELVGTSAEGYAGRMSNEEFLRILLYLYLVKA